MLICLKMSKILMGENGLSIVKLFRKDCRFLRIVSIIVTASTTYSSGSRGLNGIMAILVPSMALQVGGGRRQHSVGPRPLTLRAMSFPLGSWVRNS
jgi:hypothetical protein